MTVIASASRMPEGMNSREHLTYNNALCDLRDYLTYFDPDFHPWGEGNRYLLESWPARVI